ncbi:MAG: nuclease-related domain-containing protein [Solirubrobacteraceae bacterium]
MRDLLYPYWSGAGRGALRRYRDVSGRWRRRVSRRLLPLAIVLVFASIVVAIASGAALWVDLGVFVGGMLGGLMVLLDSPPHKIEAWRTGFEGERRTARAIAPLRRRGFVLMHDLPDRGRAGHAGVGNVDHVVVCPAGVFVLDSKWLGGSATIDGDRVRVALEDDPEDYWECRSLASAARGRAVRLQEDIAGETAVRFVQPVVVFWNRFDAELVQGRHIVFVHGHRLASWLQEQPRSHSAQWVEQVAAGVAHARLPGRSSGLGRRDRASIGARQRTPLASPPGRVR